MSLAYEIERKYLVKSIPPDVEVTNSYKVTQGYLAKSDIYEVRVRGIPSKDYFDITIKGKTELPHKREETIIKLDKPSYYELISKCDEMVITKYRHDCIYHNVNFTVDDYGNFMILEVEFDSDEAYNNFNQIPWVFQDVSDDENYKCYNICKSKCRR